MSIIVIVIAIMKMKSLIKNRRKNHYNINVNDLSKCKENNEVNNSKDDSTFANKR